MNICFKFEGQCNICYLTYDRDDMMKCFGATHKHYCCQYCIIKYFNTMLAEGRLSADCFNKRCLGKYTEKNIIKYINDKKTAHRIADEFRICEAKEEAKKYKNGQVCPRCLKYAHPFSDINYARCKICNFLWCYECKEEYHPDLPCYYIKNPRDECKINKIIDNILTMSYMHTCPSCKRKYTKDGGCEHMTCICGHESCYICKKTLKFPHYCSSYNIIANGYVCDMNIFFTECNKILKNNNDDVIFAICSALIKRNISINELSSKISIC